MRDFYTLDDLLQADCILEGMIEELREALTELNQVKASEKIKTRIEKAIYQMKYLKGDEQ